MRTTLAFVLCCLFTSVVTGIETRMVEVGDLTLPYELHLSPGGGEGKPLAIVFHGGSNDTSILRLITGITGAANTAEVDLAFVIAQEGWFPDGESLGNNVEMVQAVVNDAVVFAGSDPERVGAIGFSEGSDAALIAAISLPDIIASVVTVAGDRHLVDGVLIPTDVPETPSSLISRLAIHGLRDPSVPILGGPINAPTPEERTSPAIETALANWATSLGCDSPATQPLGEGLSSEITSYSCPTYLDVQGNQTSSNVDLIVHPGGHVWPGPFTLWPPELGRGTKEFSASTRAVDFVAAHPMAGELSSGGVLLQAGDADQDLDFDQLDLVQVQIAATYLTGEPATWGEGDWNGAPGGSVGNAPTGNGYFDQFDIIAAQLADIYLTGQYGAIQSQGTEGDGQTSVVYDAGTGEVAVDAPAGVELTSVNIDSASGVFTGIAAANLGGSFDNDADSNIFKATFGGSFGSVSFGNVAQTGLSEEFVLGDLIVVGSLAGGGALGDVDLVYVPEPSSMFMLVVGALLLTTRIRR